MKQRILKIELVIGLVILLGGLPAHILLYISGLPG